MMDIITESIKPIIEDSWQWWANRETITLTINGDESAPSYLIEDTKRFDVTKQDIPSQKQGGLVGFDYVWIIPSIKLPESITPKISDIITPQEGGEYVIQNVMLNGWKNWHRVTVRNLVLALGLSDKISFNRPIYTNSGGTRKISSYSVIRNNVPAKIVQVAGDIADDLLGKRQNRERYEIHSSWFVPWQPGDQVKDQNGFVYQIVGNSTPNTIDSYNLYVVERVK